MRKSMRARTNPSEELKGIFPETEQCYAFFDHDEPRSMVKAIDDLETYIDLEGPFPFIGAQSSGASLAASLLFHKAETDPAAASLFKCAMFFSAVTPFDYQALSMNKAKAIEPNENDNLMLCIPTVNVWGHNDKFHADQSSKLSQLCAKEFRQDIIHSENSSIPGAGDEEILIRTVHAIRRAADQTEVF